MVFALIGFCLEEEVFIEFCCHNSNCNTPSLHSYLNSYSCAVKERLIGPYEHGSQEAWDSCVQIIFSGSGEPK